MRSPGDAFWEIRPMCDFKGCELMSSFHGFKRDLCWPHYAQLLQNGGFYTLTQGGVKGKIESIEDTSLSAQLRLF